MDEKSYIIGKYKELEPVLEEIAATSKEKYRMDIEYHHRYEDGDFDVQKSLTPGVDEWPFELFNYFGWREDLVSIVKDFCAVIEARLPELEPGYKWQYWHDKYSLTEGILSLCYIIRRDEEKS